VADKYGLCGASLRGLSQDDCEVLEP